MDGTPVSPHVVEAKLEETRRRLLDLTRNNRLLNHKRTGQRTLQLIDELPEQVYATLIGRGQSMQFLSREEAPKELGELPTEDQAPSTGLALAPLAAGEQPPDRHTDRFLQTLLPGDKLQTRLVHLAREANLSLQEQGYNILYLTLGMMHWQEPSGGPVCRAPLVFVPVELERKSVHSRYTLTPFDDDILTNPCLVELCQRQFKFELPIFVSDGDAELAPYFEQVRAKLDGLAGWSFAPEVHLGLFSFSKLLMYRDLDPRAWPESRKLSAHPLIQQLSATTDIPSATANRLGIPDPRSLDDAVKPDECFQVLDADSSQQAAILAAKRGVSMVIEGPPGTGKSQTITNVIAECLAEGKSVLFVAEKAAALEVVKRRLTESGLGDAVLELHSRKASKRIVLQELQRVLSKTDKTAPPKSTPATAAELQAVRQRLNAVHHELHAPLGALAISPFDAIARATALASEPPSTCQIPNPLDWTTHELVAADEALATLDQRLARVGDPAVHPWRGVGVVPTGLDAQQRLKSAALTFKDSLAAVVERAAALAKVLGVTPPATLSAAQTVLASAKALQAAPQLSPSSLIDPRWNALSPELQKFLNLGAERDRKKSAWSGSMKCEAELLDWNDVLARRDKQKASFWRFITPSWYRDSKLIRSYTLSNQLPAIEQQLMLLRSLIESKKLRDQIEADAPNWSDLFGSHWNGPDSDWTVLRKIAEAAVAVRQLIVRNAIESSAAQAVAQLPPESRADLAAAIASLEEAIQQSSSRAAEWFSATAATDVQWLGSELKQTEFATVIARLDPLPSKLDVLRDWVDYAASLQQCQSGPLASFVTWALSPAGGGARTRLSHTFQRHFYHLWLEAAFCRLPALREFRGEEHQLRIDRFKRLDIEWLKLTRQRLASRLAEQRPDGAYAAHRQSKLGIVLAEVRKKTRHLPLRKLFAEAGDVIQTIKPCFMMSPQSVAQYLAPGCVQFDVVIFDEASQVEPADAYGAIARGKQLLLVGDEKQLPPTYFFSKVDSDEPAPDDETAADFRAADLESVLSLGLVRLPHRCSLRWHYRSRHATLIDFSNQKFYDANLRVFPSPHTDARELGLSFTFVEGGVYHRGSGRHNPIEAKAVAEQVLHHAIESPHLSLGVGTLNLPQQQAIADEIEKLRRESHDPRVEKFFSTLHENEPFFVKNLENIQGDERDVIFLSIGRAKDAEGKVSMNFGALNGEGGWRRLNVLVTRARQKCVVFSSIRHDDINLGATQARGIVALKEYLYAAENGRLPDATAGAGTEHSSDVAAAIATALRERGWDVHPQVGCAGFAIDLAVVDPNHPGRYLLGIECDGPTYQAGPTARDRDRLRQQVLQQLGWNLHRVWSADFFHSPQSVLDPLLARLEELKRHSADPPAPKPPELPPALAPAIELATETPTTVAPPVADGISDGVDPYPKRSTKTVGSLEDLLALPPPKLAAAINDIVQREGPIHHDEALRVLADRYDTRAGKSLREAFDHALNFATTARLFYRKGDFFFPTQNPPVPIRYRGDDDCPVTSADLIAPEEFQAAARLALSKEFGIKPDALAESTVRLMGFSRATPKLRAAIDEAIHSLIATQQLTTDPAGFLILPDPQSPA